MQLDWYVRGSEPLVYGLGKRGAEALAAAGEVKAGALQSETKNRDLSRLFLRHTLAVADVMVAFEVACRGRAGVTLIQPEEVLAGAPEAARWRRLPCRWQVEIRQGEKLHRLGVEPDQIFGLRFADRPEGRRVAYFFLEADRGTMPVTRKGLLQTSFLRKLLAYQETWRQGLHKTHLGIPNFRVLTVTTSEERIRHLVAACRTLRGGGSRLFLFADQGALGRGDILGHEWVNGREEGRQFIAEAEPARVRYDLVVGTSSAASISTGPETHEVQDEDSENRTLPS